MADNLGAKPYDYKDYYTSGRYPPALGVGGNPNEPAPGMGMLEKWRGFLNTMGISNKPVDPNSSAATDPGGAARYLIGAAPLATPQASQADVRKVDNAIANPSPSLVDRMFGAVAAPAVAAPAPVPAAPAPSPDMSLANELYDQSTQARPASVGFGAVQSPAAASAGSIATFPQPAARNTNFGMQGGSGESAFKSKWGDPTRGATETEQGYIARRVNGVFPGNTAGAYDTTGGDQPLPLDENGLPPSGPFAQAAARRAMYGPGDSSPIASGTGVFKGATGGAVQVSSRAGDKSTFGPVTAADEAANALHARGVSVYGVGNGPGAVPSHAALAGAGIGAIMNQRQAAQREIRSLAQRKLDVEMTGKEAAAAHSRAQTDEIMARAADAERARAAGASAEEIAAIRSGRPRAGGGVKITPTMKDGQVITTDPTGKSVLRTARPPLREADIAETLKNSPKGTTREQVIQMFKDREYDTSMFDTRRPGFGADEQMSPALRQLLIKAGHNPGDVIVN